MVFAIHTKKRQHLPTPLPPRTPLRLIIAGSRHFTDPEIVEQGMMRYLAEMMHIPLGPGQFWNRKLSEVFPTEIVHGACPGIDTSASAWAQLRKIPEKVFPCVGTNDEAKAMAEYAHILLAFWDGSSTCTKSMIDAMISLKKPHVVVYVKPALDPLPFVLSLGPMPSRERNQHDRHLQDRKHA
jgi:hypothetical protein